MEEGKTPSNLSLRVWSKIHLHSILDNPIPACKSSLPLISSINLNQHLAGASLLGREIKIIFIGGNARSGTTILGSALGSAPDAIVTPESWFIYPAWRSLMAGTIEPTYDALLGAMKRDIFFGNWRLGPSPRIEYHGDKRAFFRAVIFDLISNYARSQGIVSWSTWVDHSSANIENAVLLSEIFPESRFVHIVRDGRACAFSVLSQPWGTNDIISAANAWRYVVAAGESARCRMPEKIVGAHYEGLLENPSAELERLCGFLGVDYTPTMLNADAFAVPAGERHWHHLVGTPFNRDRRDRWRKGLSPRQVELFEWRAGKMLDILGYDRMYVDPRGLSALEWCRFLVRRAWGLLVYWKHLKTFRRSFSRVSAVVPAGVSEG